MKDINSIHDKLGLSKDNGLYLAKDGSIADIKKIKKLYEIEDFEPHSVYCIDEKPFIIFYENPADTKALFKAIWNLNEVPIVIISEPDAVSIYNGFDFIIKGDNKTLSRIGSEQELDKFEYFRLVSGETWEEYKDKLSYKNRVDYKLLENIKAARDKLIDECKLDNETANALLGRAIFVRYLIDRKVRIAFQSDAEEWTNDRFCELLTDKDKTGDFFVYLKERFNGDLFPINESKIEIGEDALKVVIDLLKGVEIKSGQLNLFEVYDFSIIPVEFISNVYELFIGQEKQEETGSYYTPLFMVEYITSKTVNEYFDKYKDKYDCKVLDPACGSGIFLVEILRSVIDRFISLNEGKPISAGQLCNLLVDNIYGVDRDSSAVNIAIFSVYLTLLDYQSPKDIESFKFPLLLGTNFFKADFFNESHEFNDFLKKFDFDYIVGNPPWKRGAKIGALFPEYIKERKRKEGKIEVPITISNKEIAQAFMIRVSDFSSHNTTTSLIITGKLLYNLQGRDFRKYLLTNYFVDEVLDLSSVRKEVFDKSNDPSVAPPMIITFRYADEQDTRNNKIIHRSVKPNRFFTLFKLFLVQGKDVKTVQQSMVMKYDWLWKLLVYGSYLDFSFIRRMKETFFTIEDTIEEKGCQKGQGVQVKSNNPQESPELLNKVYVETKNDFNKFWIGYNSDKKWTIDKVHRKRDKELFCPPSILIKKGTTSEYRAVAAVNYDKSFVFTDSITAIRSNDVNLLSCICGYLSSSIFPYLALIEFSSTGKEREQAFQEEFLSIPYVEDDYIVTIVNKLHQYTRKIKDDISVLSLSTEWLKGEIKKLQEELDEAVYKALDLNEIEKSLVDYGVNYTIPSIMKQKNPTVLKKLELYKPLMPDKEKDDEKYLKKYTDVFYQRFANYLREKGKNLSVEIIASDHILGMVFTFGKDSDQDYTIKLSGEDNNQLVARIIQLGHYKITNQLFMQKDIRGFDTDSFYIFKPNEKMLWHKAIAYLDMNDFVDAMLRAGKE